MLKKKLKHIVIVGILLLLTLAGVVYALNPVAVTLTPAGSNGLLGYWKLGENDAISNEEDLKQHLFSSAGFGPDTAGKTVVLDAQGAETRPIQPGRAYNFDGTDDYVEIADHNDLQIAGDISVSLWVKYPTPTSGYQIIATKQRYIASNDNSGWEIGILDSNPDTGKIIIKSAENAGMLERVKSTNNLDDGKWHHVTFTRDTNNSWKLYIDNDLNASATGTDGDISGVGSVVRIGQGVGTPSFNSEIEVFDFRIFKEVLSDGGVAVGSTAGGEIRELYEHNPSVATANLVGHWKLDEGSGLTAYDSSGNGNHGTLDANGATAGSGTTAEIAAMHTTQNEYSFQNEVGYSGALDFDGTDDYVKIPYTDNSLKFTGNGSIAAWIKLDSYPTAAEIMETIFVRDTSISSWGMRIGIHSSEKAVFDIVCNGQNYNILSSDTLELNQWYHFVGVRNGENIKIYLDGVEKGNNSTGCSGSLRIGDTFSTIGAILADATPGGHFDGNVSNLRVYDNALTENQIRYLAGTSTDQAHDPGTTNLVGKWGLNEMSGTTAFDSSGRGHNGTLCNNTTCPSSDGPQWHSIPRNEKTGETTNDVAGKTLDYSGRAKYNARLVNSNAATFDGADDYINVPDHSGTAVAKLTVSAWVKTNNLTTGEWGTILAKDTNVGSYKRLYWFGLNSDEKLYLSLGTYGGNPAVFGFTDYANDSITLDIDTWHHVAATYEVNVSDNAKIYLDGVLIKEVGHSQSQLTNDIEHVHIGRSINGHYFDGQIADVRIFDEILTGAQIKEISQGKVNVVPNNVVGWWPLAEGAGSTAYDASGGGNNGTVYSGASVMTSTTGLGTFWNTKQDAFHYNIQKGFHWTGTGPRIPAIATGINAGKRADSTSDDPSNPAEVWHNDAETKFENYSVSPSNDHWLVAPALFQADKINDNCTTCTSSDGVLTTLTTAVSRTLNYENIATTMGDKNYFVAIPEANKKRDLKIFGSSPILTKDSSDQENHFKYAENTTFPGFNYTNDHKNNPNRAITFNGGADKVLNLGTSITGLKSINLWLKKGANTKDLINLNSTMNLKIDTSGVITATGITSPTIYLDSVQTATPTISDTDWHMVTITTGTGITADAVKFGAVGSTYFNGSMDEVRFYNRVLDQREIDVLYEKIEVTINPNQAGGVIIISP